MLHVLFYICKIIALFFRHNGLKRIWINNYVLFFGPIHYSVALSGPCETKFDTVFGI